MSIFYSFLKIWFKSKNCFFTREKCYKIAKNKVSSPKKVKFFMVITKYFDCLIYSYKP